MGGLPRSAARCLGSCTGALVSLSPCRKALGSLFPQPGVCKLRLCHAQVDPEHLGMAWWRGGVLSPPAELLHRAHGRREAWGSGQPCNEALLPIVFRAFETQMTRLEAEFVRREAPPSYGQLIAQGLIPPVEDFPVYSAAQVRARGQDPAGVGEGVGWVVHRWGRWEARPGQGDMGDVGVHSPIGGDKLVSWVSVPLGLC